MASSVLNSHLKFKRYEPISNDNATSSHAELMNRRSMSGSKLATRGESSSYKSFQLFQNGLIKSSPSDTIHEITTTPTTTDTNTTVESLDDGDGDKTNNESNDSVPRSPILLDGLLEDTNKLIESRRNLMQELKIDHKLYEETINNICRSIDERGLGSKNREKNSVELNDTESQNALNSSTNDQLILNDKPRKIHISHIAKKRAEKVDSIIENYYSCIEKYQNTVHYDEETDLPKYPNVERVFNPLQIIRNRRVRKKNNEKLPIFPYGRIKLPSRVFSKYKTQHLIWQVNLNEYNNDIYWRENYWHELKNPKGELWFPKLNSSHSHFSKFDKPKAKKRLHEQLFAGFDGEFNEEDDDYDGSGIIVGTSTNNSNEEKRLNSLPRINESSASLARHGHYRQNSLKKPTNPTSRANSISNANANANANGSGTKSPGNLYSLLSNDVDRNDSLTNANNHIIAPQIKIQRIDSPEDQSPVRSNKSLDFNSALLKNNTSFDSFSVAPFPSPDQQLNPSSKHSHNLSSSGLSARRNSNLSAYSRYSDDENSASAAVATSSNTEPDQADELLDQVRTIRSLKSKLFLSESKMNYFEMTMDSTLLQSQENIEQKLNDFRNLQYENDIVSRKLVKKINEIDHKLDKFNGFNNSKSMKIEELLGSTDRTNGEINTSVTLKIRDLHERRDQLVRLDDEWIFNIFYSCLENSIVLLLWVVWIFVEIWRFIKQVLTIVINILKWIFL
ncbi:hypothetical protein CANARDRAFT_27594 [[Candida] arabinofermentans NRRL YB-2248]|uniref:Maintenance of telomere capping protein 4 n=1 Tax=[Candida] arabinofermentans NRRL YB-2248 TaxID=983967 RepID=A0A1E4T3R3_9ASCO|nr:hypothetical protein CANARDRAFT_27594 [[Candida] arabinofermentans NRRL YB-2248]